MEIKIEVRILEMKEGNPTVLYDEDGTTYYKDPVIQKKNKYPKNRKPSYYPFMVKWIVNKKQFTIEDLQRELPKAPYTVLNKNIALLIKENKLRQRDDIKKGMLEVIK